MLKFKFYLVWISWDYSKIFYVAGTYNFYVKK